MLIRKLLPGMLILVIAVVVQWFVANIAMQFSHFGTFPSTSEKVQIGLDKAFFFDTMDNEELVLTTIAVLMIPALAGVQYLGCFLGRRICRSKVREQRPFPYSRVLTASWVWLVYWPVWLLLFYIGIARLPWISFLGGTVIIPPLLALVVGYLVAWKMSQPRCCCR